MTRLYGRAVRGERVKDFVPDGRWSSTTMLAAMNWNGSGPCLTYSGGTDVPTMMAFVEQLLLRAVQNGSGGRGSGRSNLTAHSCAS
jgi:hypothetical protein